MVAIVGFLFSTSSGANSAIISEFTASSDGSDIFIFFRSNYEAGISSFVLQRSIDGLQFHDVFQFDLMGAGSYYSYRDNPLEKSTSSNAQSYYYRLRISFDNGSSSQNSGVVEVQFSISSFARTWGSIKAMFR